MNQRAKLNHIELGQSILRENGFVLEEHQDYDWMITLKYAGYANYYLESCLNRFTGINYADVSIHRQLIDIDSKLGSDTSLQLYGCLSTTTRSDLIKV